MTGKKPIGSDIRSDLKNTDALSITPEQYQEIPELTEQWFSEAEPHVGGRKVGRPKSANPKVPLKLRLDRDVVQAVDLGLPARPGGPERYPAAEPAKGRGRAGTQTPPQTTGRPRHANPPASSARQGGNVSASAGVVPARSRSMSSGCNVRFTPKSGHHVA